MPLIVQKLQKSVIECPMPNNIPTKNGKLNYPAVYSEPRDHETNL